MESPPRKKRWGAVEGSLAAELKRKLIDNPKPTEVTDAANVLDLEIVARKKAKIIAEQKQFDKDPIGTTYHAKDRRIRNLERRPIIKTNEEKIPPEKG